MSDSDRAARDGVARRRFLTAVGATGLASLAGCGGGPVTTDAATSTGTRTVTTTEPPTETPTETATETQTPVEAEDGPLSPLPVPEADGVVRPSGEPGNLRVLDWAGFESAVSYTFDDSQPSHLAHYDALHATGADLTFYLSSNLDDEAYREGWKQVVADGHEVGNHTVSHPHADLTGSSFGEPLETKRAEIAQCSEYVTDALGQRDVWTMAGPFGDEGWNAAAEKADLFLNRGVGGGTIAPDDDTDPYELPCYMASEGETAEQFDAEVDSARSNGEWLVFLFHSIRPTDAEWFAPVDVSEITGSIEHAQSFDDVWVDTVANVGAYWLGQRLFAGATPTESGEETVWNWTLPDAFPPGRKVRVTVDGGTLKQGGTALEWDSHGYYEVSLDEESLSLTP